jgi:hypothetical protein
VAARTDAARAEVVAARDAFATEFTQMGTATRAAVDVPAKIRRAPVQSAALAGGAAFLVLGGPGRVLGRVKRLVRGQPAPLPKSMLPDEIEKAVRKLGSDGDAVRGALERSFAEYLDKRGSLAQRDVKTAGGEVAASMIKLVGRVVGIQLVRRLLAGGPTGNPSGGTIEAEKARFGAALEQVHERVAKASTADEGPEA